MKIIDELFWKKIEIKGSNDCWEWQGCLDSKGYGRLRRRLVQQGLLKSNRYAFYLYHGKWPDNFACHICDNRKCCNPKHLFDGTASENVRDMVEKGRNVCKDSVGEKNDMAILTEKIVIKIREGFHNDLNNKQIGKIYGVHHSTISALKSRKSWKHI